MENGLVCTTQSLTPVFSFHIFLCRLKTTIYQGRAPLRVTSLPGGNESAMTNELLAFDFELRYVMTLADTSYDTANVIFRNKIPPGLCVIIEKVGWENLSNCSFDKENL